MKRFVYLSTRFTVDKDNIKSCWKNVVKRFSINDASLVEQFEEKMARYCDSVYCSVIGESTSGLHIALKALGIRYGDEVILPANSPYEAFWGTRYVDAKPVFVDCDIYNNIDVHNLESKITSKTKAIIGVHLYGQPCNIDVLLEIATKYNLHFIEEASQAIGAMYNGQKCGSFGILSCFGLNTNKYLDSWEQVGGITTKHLEYKKKFDKLRNEPYSLWYFFGNEFNDITMNGFQALILEEKLSHFDKWICSRRTIANRYLLGINNEHIQLPKILKNTVPSWQMFVILVKNPVHFIAYLNNNRIQTERNFSIPLHLDERFEYLGYKSGDFPQTEYLALHSVFLPIYDGMWDSDINFVINTVNKYIP